MLKKDVLYTSLAEWYDKVYYSDERTDEEVKFIDKFLKTHKCKRVLEISAGSGRLTIPLKKLGYDITGTDISKEMIDLAKKKSKKENLEIPFYVQGMEKTKVSGKLFDCVLLPCSSPLYMLNNNFAIETLKRCNSHLKKEGILFFDVQNYWKRVVEGVFHREDKPMQNQDWKMQIYHDQKINKIKGLYEDNQVLMRWIKDKKLPTIKRKTLFRVYNLNEIDLLFRLTGFKIIESYSEYNFKKLSEENSKRYTILAKKI